MWKCWVLASLPGVTQVPHDEALDDHAGTEGVSRQYARLDQALLAHGIPLENHALIRRVTHAIGIDAFYERGTYIKAVRAQGGPALQIHYVWTDGFVSEHEVVTAAGEDTPRWRSDRGRGQWGIDHPVHGHPSAGGGSKPRTRHYGVCPRCHMQLLPGGRCGDCDA